MVLLRGGSDQAGRRRKEFRSSVRYAPKALFGENIRSCEPFVEAAAKKRRDSLELPRLGGR